MGVIVAGAYDIKQNVDKNIEYGDYNIKTNGGYKPNYMNLREVHSAQ